jgi:hypothetical protein
MSDPTDPTVQEPAEGSPARPEPDEERPLRSDPTTGSTPEEPNSSGLPPAGTDPMAGGQAPSG